MTHEPPPEPHVPHPSPDESLDDLLHDPHDPQHDLEVVVEAARAAAERRDRGRGRWIVLLSAAVVIMATATVGAVRPGWLPFDLPGLPFRAETPVTPAVPLLRRSTALRSEPREDASVLVRLDNGTELRVVGKSADGRWLAAAAAARPDLLGWLLADAVAGVDLGGLATVTADPSAAGGIALPAGPAERPDLRIESVYAKENRLYVAVFNAGPADARGTLQASVDGAPPAPLEGKADEGLRAGQRIQAPVRGAYVQIRSAIAVTVSLSPSASEVDQANNTFSGIVEPDQPVDLEISNVERGASALVVTVRNNSAIPIAGSHTITVREALPSTRLLGRVEQGGVIEAGRTMVVSFPDLREVDLTRISITLSSDSVADAALANNSYPR